MGARRVERTSVRYARRANKWILPKLTHARRHLASAFLRPQIAIVTARAGLLIDDPDRPGRAATRQIEATTVASELQIDTCATPPETHCARSSSGCARE